MVELR
jgi:hypothetical protein